MSTSPGPADGLQHARQVWWSAYLLVVGSGVLIAALARRRLTEPFLGLSLAVIMLILLGWLIRPRATLYVTLFLTAISDVVTVWWFPFAKNLSSRESISFVADSLTISPLEITLYLGVAVSCLRRYAQTRTIMPRTPLTWPLVVFTLFVVYGFVRGINSGGDLRIAVIEGRALFYILLVFVIVVNECTERIHLRWALWAVLAGVVVQSLLSINYLNRLDPRARDSLQGLNEHGSALGHNIVTVTMIGLLLLHVKRPLVKWAVLAALVPTVYVFFLSQRRSGVAALVIAGAVMAVALLWRRPRAFWLITPFLTLLLIGYAAVYWNSTSSLAFPAQAIKSIIAPQSASAEDRSSDLYRLIEAYDVNYTIRLVPLLGLGFGRQFYRPVFLPDISVFGLNAYVPHNNILWIWIKTGFFGFASMFYLFAKAIMMGAARVRRAVLDVDLVVTLTATLYAVMFAVYSYVDVSWDARNTVFLGLAFAICGGEVGGRTPEAVDGDGARSVADPVYA
jgi:O-antigen ligase